MEWAIDLRFDLRNALWAIAAFEDILENLEKAHIQAVKLDDQRRLGWISVFNSASLWQLGRSRHAIDAANQSLEISESANDLSLAVGSQFYLGCCTVTSGDCENAESIFAQIVDMLDGELEFERCGLPFVPSVVARSWLVWALAERGKFEQGQRYGNEALMIAKAVGHPFNLAHIYYDLGYFYQVKGDYTQAVETMDKAMQIVKEWSLTYLSPFIMGFLGHSCALAGDHERGIKLLKQANQDYDNMGLGLFRSLVKIQLGEALFLSGNNDDATEVLQQGINLAESRGEKGHLAYGLKILGEISIANKEETDTSAQFFHQALELANKFGMRPLAARCYRSIGSVLNDTEAHEKAQQIFTELGISE